MILSLLSIVGGGRTEGADIEMGSLFKLARRGGLWPEAQTPSRGALSKARAKVPWKAFSDIFEKAVALAYETWPERPGDRWHGMNVLAIDGSKYTLPATAEIRKEFDPESGLEFPGRGHYPKCLVSTLYDVFRAIPLARTVAPYRSCEREQALELIGFAPEGSLIVFDRGYPSYEMFLELQRRFSGRFLMRCPRTNTFPALEAFLQTSKPEGVVSIAPSRTYLRSLPIQERNDPPHIAMRAIRAEAPDGDTIVFLTDLMDAEEYARDEIVKLYFKRWEVEVYYLEEKDTHDLKHFHSRSVNGVQQELFAVMIVTVISRVMSAQVDAMDASARCVVQRKHAAVCLARDAAILAPCDPEKALAVFEELLREMARVRYYPPKKPKPSQPRVSKAPPNKWNDRNRLAKAA